MVYVMSDLHGCYDKYKEMLEKINFKDSDRLYILGDIVDRGDRPIDILIDMMSRSNIFPLIGNHEAMALNILKELSREITEETLSNFDETLINNLISYQLNGGISTIKQFQQQSIEQREAILEYIQEEFVPYEIVRMKDNKKYILVHSGLGNFSKDKSLDEYTLQELTYIRHDYNRKYFSSDDIYIVSGHTTTLKISGDAKIYKANNNICIDCGAVFGGKLACLCLDTLEEFYV